MNVKKVPTDAKTMPKRLLSISEAMVYLGIGRNSALKYLKDIGAKRRIGKRVLYDKSVIDEHLDRKEENLYD